jgi:hypothetical protein
MFDTDKTQLSLFYVKVYGDIPKYSSDKLLKLRRKDSGQASLRKNVRPYLKNN